jgi:hypothetical protein
MFALTRRLLGTSLLATAVLLSACSDDEDDPIAPPTPPAAPTGVTVSALSPVSNRITWTAIPGVTGYAIERAAGAGAFAEIATPTAATYDDVGLDSEVSYRYRVAAINSAGKGAFSSEASAGDLTRIDVTQDITTSTTWTANNVYVLKGFIKVANGATLTIQPGTRIEGDFNTLGASLFILRGARLVANGTAQAPIVFTSSRPVGQRQPGDWGGLIIVGNGIINRGQPVILEGTGTGAANPQVDYSGGTNNLDNSGSLRYVRVEFAGYATAQDAELNTFTFAAVGAGTTMEYLQAMSGLDDAFEWFGGAVDGKYFVSYETGDDHFDMSEGYSGRLQYLIAMQTRILTPRPAAGSPSTDPQGIENDGCNGANCLAGEESQPFTQPLVANFTMVGTGPGVVPNVSSGVGMVLRRGTAGFYVNGHLTRWPNGGIGLRNSSATAVATANRINDGSLLLRNILVTDGALFETGSNRLTVDATANALESQAGTATAGLFTLFTATPTGESSLDWSPSASAPQRTGGLATFTGSIATKASTFVTGTTFRGAADPAGAKWWAGWTNYAAN